jgi:hypothetical protein
MQAPLQQSVDSVQLLPLGKQVGVETGVGVAGSIPPMTRSPPPQLIRVNVPAIEITRQNRAHMQSTPFSR